MDYQLTSVKELTSNWEEISQSYKAREAEFIEAWKNFMADCDSRDSKVAERKAELLKENQEYGRQLEALGKEYAKDMLDGQEKKSSVIKQQMQEVASKRAANGVLIASVERPMYSEKLLQEAEDAFAALGDASMQLSMEKTALQNTLDSMIEDLKKLNKAISFVSDFKVHESYDLRMHRRYNGQSEETERPAGAGGFSAKRIAINPDSLDADIDYVSGTWPLHGSVSDSQY